MTDEAAGLAAAVREEQSRRDEQNSVAAAPEPPQQYRNLRECLEDVGHNMPLENQMTTHPDTLPYAVRDLAARGLTDAAIQKEIGAMSLATVRRLRAHLRCEAPNEDPPPDEAA